MIWDKGFVVISYMPSYLKLDIHKCFLNSISCWWFMFPSLIFSSINFFFVFEMNYVFTYMYVNITLVISSRRLAGSIIIAFEVCTEHHSECTWWADCR